MAKIGSKWRHLVGNEISQLGEASVHGPMYVYVCTCICAYVHHMSRCESGRGRQAKLMILSRLEVSPRIQAGPMVDKCCPSHHHS